MARQRWKSRWIYILAAIGCAAGLGNLWRFPMLAYDNGGAAFIIALVISNLLIVFPLVMVETILGQRTQHSGPFALESLRKKRGWIMWLPVFTLCCILLYYLPVMGWALRYFVQAFTGDFLLDPSSYFTENIIGLSESASQIGGLQWGVVAAVAVCVIAIFASLYKGLQSVSKVLKFTATAPFILLFILVVRGITLPGAMTGLQALFIPDRSQLLDPSLWQAAVGQSFFSASLAFGYFVIMGSYRDSQEEVPATSAWIIAGNFLVSLLSGVAVFSTLGYMAQSQGVDLSQAAISGPSLVFSVLPTALALMPFFAMGFVVLLFAVVITLAIDSIFGMLETIVGTLHDSVGKNISTRRVLTIVISCIAVGSLPYMTGAGMYYLDITDHFVGGYLLMIIGALFSAVMAYEVGARNLRERINQTTPYTIGKWFEWVLYSIPILLIGIVLRTFVWEIVQTLMSLTGLSSAPLYGNYPAVLIIVFGLVPLCLVFGGSICAYRYFQRR